MSTFDEVMAEEWTGTFDGEVDVVHPNGAVEPEVITCMSACDEPPEDEMRAHIAVLGKRALALVLKHEWCTRGTEDWLERYCPECGAMKDTGKHTEGCAWGSVCEEARKMAGVGR